MWLINHENFFSITFTPSLQLIIVFVVVYLVFYRFQILTSCVNLEYEEASEGADIKPSLVSKTGAAKNLEGTQFRAFEEALVKLTPSV